MADLFSMKKQRAFAQNKADSILAKAEGENRELTAAESQEIDVCLNAVTALSPQIAKAERQCTLRQRYPNGHMLTPNATASGAYLRQAHTPGAPPVFSMDYYEQFHDWVGSRGQQIGAAMYEGSGPAGGYVVPTVTEDQVVPLAPSEMGVRSVATVVPTASDIKIPFGVAFGDVDGKLESGAESHSFTDSAPELDQFTLSAFMAGGTRTISWELAQDVPSFQQYCITDLILAMQMREENLYVNCSGN